MFINISQIIFHDVDKFNYFAYHIIRLSMADIFAIAFQQTTDMDSFKRNTSMKNSNINTDKL